ncbi:SPW repeat protein [Microvirga sp. Mcv34]|uniref:SPW repeat protein n=1 Tax=Microvirga sp. Mcv34 TaxID=2926016 RepID=UPI0021CABE89|nr:SPW repeat protein [Microvirga sp. Mcv34]
MKLKHWSELTIPNVINAPLGAFLAVSPWLLGFSTAETATWSAGLVGALACLIALAGLARPQQWQTWASLVVGLWAAVAPWALGFAGETNAAWCHLTVGLTTVVVAAFALFWIYSNPRKLAH